MTTRSRRPRRPRRPKDRKQPDHALRLVEELTGWDATVVRDNGAFGFHMVAGPLAFYWWWNLVGGWGTLCLAGWNEQRECWHYEDVRTSDDLVRWIMEMAGQGLVVLNPPSPAEV